MKLYKRNGLKGKEEVLVDPAALTRAGGSPYAINYFAPSWDGRYVAYGLSAGGSEKTVLHILDTKTGRESGETISRTPFEYLLSWLPGKSAFFYNRLQDLGPGAPKSARLENSRVYLHLVGTNPKNDRVVLAPGLSNGVEVAPADFPFVYAQPGSAYAIAVIVHGVDSKQTDYVAPLAGVVNGKARWSKIGAPGDGVDGFDLHGGELYLLSRKDAPRRKILRTTLPGLTWRMRGSSCPRARRPLWTSMLQRMRSIFTCVTGLSEGFFVFPTLVDQCKRSRSPSERP